MKAESHRSRLPLDLEPRPECNVLVPPFVKTIAVRLCWASSVEEAEAYRLLSSPYYHDAVTEDDRTQLCARFPFMAAMSVPATIADYTISLVTVWLLIEEMYHRGTVLPDDIMRGLMKKTTTMQAHDCRKDEEESAA
ncbi:hypothetical protein ACUY4R_001337 [Kosakonia sp. BK9b]|uniref:hypothetical protein n=1 Tax=Kosakonia sp. TaxID=1916651 RepID=UPI002898518C|nr:hypothetical protein [Kosakonia sp.]